MHAAELFTELRTRGVTLYPTPEGIRYEAPRGTLTPELRAAMVAHKAELLRLLELCEHVASDSALADWYRENPHLTCARCFLEGGPLRSWLQ